jgi:hypothetical protein
VSRMENCGLSITYIATATQVDCSGCGSVPGRSTCPGSTSCVK